LPLRPLSATSTSTRLVEKIGEKREGDVTTTLWWRGATVALALGATPAMAQVCAPRKISATGQTAQFALLGKISARTAWSSKVAGDPRLGSPYSTWLRGKERRLVCRKVERRHVCLAIALPCRSSSIFAAPVKSAPPNPKQRPL
jgi:hypothetical protein